MDQNHAYKDYTLVKLIDNLAPLNNEFRIGKDPISKIELMWEFGKVLNDYLGKTGKKLHTLLHEIYDPHSTVKMSYITRDLGSYCFRIFKFFIKKEDIKIMLPGLKSYAVFREAVPLLFNPLYKSNLSGNKILGLINSNRDPKLISKELKILKQKIRPIKNSRTQKSYQYYREKMYLQKMSSSLSDLYSKNDNLPSENITSPIFGDREARITLVNILMSLADDSFLDKIDKVNSANLGKDEISLVNISKSTTENRARFRRWVMSSTNLLLIAEGIYALSDEDNFQFFRRKFIKGNPAE